MNGSGLVMMDHDGSFGLVWVLLGLVGSCWVLMDHNGSWDSLRVQRILMGPDKITKAPIAHDGYQWVLIGSDGSQWLLWLTICINGS
jgi:hypothetical protein